MKKIINPKLLGIVANSLVILSLFMNVVVIKANVFNIKNSLQYIRGDGKILLVMSLINLSIILFGKISHESPKLLTKIIAIEVMSLIELIIIINFTVKGGNVGYNEHVTWNWGIGFYLMWIGVIISTISPLLLYKETRKEE